MNNKYIAIMAGGVGSRFWPSSTEQHPKQFLDVLDIGKSLLRMTYERFLPIVPKENILIVTNKAYRDLCIEHIPELPQENILCEPSRNNTAPCVAYTALHLRAKNPDAMFLMAPSDHVILKEQAFLARVEQAFAFIEDNDAIVTLGITPTRPDTGYGYIEMTDDRKGEVYKVSSFKEKPTRDVAEQYISQGNYLWNAGIFVWKVKDILASFEKNTPEILSILSADTSSFGTTDEQEYIDKVYPDTPNISVDYAILEKADNVFTLPSDIGWSDLGTWSSLYDYINTDKEETSVVQSASPRQHIEVHNSLVRIDDTREVLIRGLEDYIVVSNADALLIYPKSQEQELKESLKKMS